MYELPLSIVCPMFFADPAGAIVGKFCSRTFGNKLNPKWPNSEKSICGSLAVLIVTYYTIMFPISNFNRLLLSFIASFVELIGGDYDNLLIVAATLICYPLLRSQ